MEAVFVLSGFKHIQIPVAETHMPTVDKLELFFFTGTEKNILTTPQKGLLDVKKTN